MKLLILFLSFCLFASCTRTQQKTAAKPVDLDSFSVDVDGLPPGLVIEKRYILTFLNSDTVVCVISKPVIFVSNHKSTVPATLNFKNDSTCYAQAGYHKASPVELIWVRNTLAYIKEFPPLNFKRRPSLSSARAKGTE
jgi:hypothetical protein